MTLYPQTYPATFRDHFGGEETVIVNDAATLRMTVRGVPFVSKDTVWWKPDGVTLPEDVPFAFSQHGELCACEFAFTQPLSLIDGEGEAVGDLETFIRLGVPAERGWLSETFVQLTLHYKGETYKGNEGYEDDLEEELLDIIRQLPLSVKLHCCFTCAYSDYSPYGHQYFGGLACFRDNKAGYLQAKTKMAVLRVWNTNSGMVQETYQCDQYAPRVRGTGYRG